MLICCNVVECPTYFDHLRDAGVIFGREQLLGSPVLLQEARADHVRELCAADEQQPQSLRDAVLPAGGQQRTQLRPHAARELLLRYLEHATESAGAVSE